MADSTPVPSITGDLSPTFTVTSLERSVHWYRQLLDLTTRREYEPDDKHQRDACLLEPRSGLEICLVEYSGGSREPFDELAPGLAHLEFLVAERTDLDEWAERLGLPWASSTLASRSHRTHGTP